MKRRLFFILLFGLMSACVRAYPGATSGPQGYLTPPPAPGTDSLAGGAATPESAPPPDGGASVPSGETAAPSGSVPPLAEPVPYAVVLVSPESGLNLRAEPSLNAPVLALLPYDARDLRPTGRQEQAEGFAWAEIETPFGAGWVSAAYLTMQISPEVFCGNAQVQALVDSFVQAVRNEDGAALAALVSPVHGLTIRHEWWNPEVVFDAADVETLFSAQETYDWGIQDGSGDPLQGRFADVVLPRLQDVVQGEFSVVCDSLAAGEATGGTAGLVNWPYPNLPFVALYRAAPADQELDWRTWALGIVWWQGRPYLAALVQYHWEI
ncbi:MAG: hypothetical protein Fur0018_12310 [Anaerolineales bacterium]